MSRPMLFLSALAAGLLFAQDAAGALISEDEFLYGGNGGLGQYTATIGSGRNQASSNPGRIVPGTTSGQNPSNLGFTSAQRWEGQATALWQVHDGLGLSYTGLITDGGGLLYDWTSAISRLQHRNLNAPPTVNVGDTYYMSALVQYRANSSSSSAFAWGGFASAGQLDPDGALSDDNIYGWRVGFQAKTGGTMDLVLRHRDSSGTAVSDVLDGSASAGETHLVVIRGTKGAASDTIDVWLDPNVFVLGPADYTFSDSSLQDSNPFSVLAAEAINYYAPSSTAIAGVVLDEFRLGTSLRDVAPVPEPSTLVMLLGLGGIGLLGYLRRRRRS